MDGWRLYDRERMMEIVLVDGQWMMESGDEDWIDGDWRIDDGEWMMDSG